MNRRTRLGVGACLVVLALLAGCMTWAASPIGPSGRGASDRNTAPRRQPGQPV